MANEVTTTATGTTRMGLWRSRRARILASLAVIVLLAAYAGISRLSAESPTGPIKAAAAAEGIPLMINHQGFVTVNNKPFKGDGYFRFALVDQDSGNNLWTNDGSNLPGPGTPTAAVVIPVDKGVYSVALGDSDLTNMVEIPTAVFGDDNVVLRIWFTDEAGGTPQQLSPDLVLTSVPYAYRSASAVLADQATIANHATTSDVATNADHATTADSATITDHATTADTADNATTADYATTAGHATTADTADNATTADSAITADHATTADTADNATTADYATTAGHATTADSLTNPVLPAGVIVMWSGSTATIPTGWALCNGASGRPDLRNRFIVGAGDEYAVAAKGGEKTHTLTIAEMPAHSHSSLRTEKAAPDGESYNQKKCTGGGSTGSTGGGGAHENRPPYYALAYIIKLP